ncbi:ABC transporter permease [Bacteroidota bacterium]
MFKNYLKIAYRNIIKYKGYTFINIAGLTIGIACCLLILLYVKDELSFDRFHNNAERIYRVIEHVKIDGVGEESASMPFPFGETIPIEFPDAIESTVRLFDFQSPTLALENQEIDEKRFNEANFYFADSNVFQMFNFELLRGNPETVLDEPNSIVLTESMVPKYFDNEDPIGKTLRFQNFIDLQVTGIAKDAPPNSHIQFDFLTSFSTLRQFFGGQIPQNWYWNPCWTYILLRENVSPDYVESQFPSIIEKYFPNNIKDKTTIFLQPLIDIHLKSHLDYEMGPNSDISYVYIFSGIAVFILCIACINFMNLSTARSANRSREVGMRKVLGAYKIQLIKQFIGESILTSFVAAILAVVAVQLFLPTFNSFAGKNIIVNYFNDAFLILILVLIALFVGVVSGMYPAFFLSAFQPTDVLKGKLSTGARNSVLRKTLVVIQFAISVILIIGTGILFQQLNFLKNQKLGYDKDQIIMVHSYNINLAAWYDAFKGQIMQDPRVLNVTVMEEALGAKYQTSTYTPEGSSDDQSHQIPRLLGYFDFIETFGMEMAAGRSYTIEFAADTITGIILNEEAAKYFGWTPEEAIGKAVSQAQGQFVRRVVGVVKNFNYASLHQPIDPFILELPQNRFQVNFFLRYIAVKIKPGDLQSTLAFLEDRWNNVVPNRSFDYFFLDESLNKLYEAEVKMGKVFSAFSILAILIACLGLFALASFTAEQRTKEVGIRKVMGASVPGIVGLLSKEFLILVIIANFIAWPLAAYGMTKWLNTFAYRVEFGYSSFILAAIAAVVIALLTVSYQAIKAATANPADSLRSE